MNSLVSRLFMSISLISLHEKHLTFFAPFLYIKCELQFQHNASFEFLSLFSVPINNVPSGPLTNIGFRNSSFEKS